MKAITLLKRRLGIFPSTRPTPHGDQPTFLLPEDILLEITDHLAPADILNFGLASASIYACIRRALYASVTLNTNQQCSTTLSFLLKHVETARYIRKLVVRPNSHEWSVPETKVLAEGRVATMIERLAAHLFALHTFIWDSQDLPCDSMWSALRTLCPRLRNIGSSVNEYNVRPESQLFAFSDLLGFTLWIKPRPSRRYPPRVTGAAIVGLPGQLWDMLLDRCPNLGLLTLNISRGCSQRFDIPQLLEGRWPHLRSMMIGDIWILINSLRPEERSTMMAFVAAHVNLESFGGVTGQVEELPELPSLRYLRLVSIGQRSHTIPTLVRGLRNVSSITSLSIWFSFITWDCAQNVAMLFRCCSQIVELELYTCRLAPTFDDVSVALPNLPQLRLLTLIMVQYAENGNMLDSAIRLFRSNAHLHHVKLKQATARWHHLEEIRLKQIGTYLLTRDENGRPLDIAVQERGMRVRVLPFGARYCINYRYSFSTPSVVGEESAE